MTALKLFYSYKHVRKKTKVERAVNFAQTIERDKDPLRHLMMNSRTNREGDNSNRQTSLCFLQ